MTTSSLSAKIHHHLLTYNSKVSNERRMWRRHSTEGPQADELLRRALKMTVGCGVKCRGNGASSVQMTRQLSSTPQPGRCPAKHFGTLPVLTKHTNEHTRAYLDASRSVSWEAGMCSPDVNGLRSSEITSPMSSSRCCVENLTRNRMELAGTAQGRQHYTLQTYRIALLYPVYCAV